MEDNNHKGKFNSLKSLNTFNLQVYSVLNFTTHSYKKTNKTYHECSLKARLRMTQIQGEPRTTLAKLSCSLYSRAMICTRGGFVFKRTFGTIWNHFWLSLVGRCWQCYCQVELRTLLNFLQYYQPSISHLCKQ